MNKQQLWIQVCVESIKNRFSTIEAETAATKAVEAFEKRFGNRIELNDLIDEDLINTIKRLKSSPDQINEKSVIKRCLDRVGVSYFHIGVDKIRLNTNVELIFDSESSQLIRVNYL